jgi:Flp pilus assembly pilin Flp
VTRVEGRVFGTRVVRQMRALWACEDGSDLIEYALLTALIGIVSITTWSLIAGKLGGAYASYDTGTQGLWASPDPQ